GEGGREGGGEGCYDGAGLRGACEIGLVRDTDQKKSRSLEVVERSRRIRRDLQLRQVGRGMRRSIPYDGAIQDPVTDQEHGATQRFPHRTDSHSVCAALSCGAETIRRPITA